MPTTENQLLPDCSRFEKDIIDRQLKANKQEEYYNKRSKDLSVLHDGDEVWVKPHTLGERNGNKRQWWLSAVNLDHMTSR